MSDENQILDSTVKTAADFKTFNYPISFRFKIGTIANDFVAEDANGATLAYVRQKLFKFKEAILVYAEESKTNLLYKIDADRVIDFNANYTFTDAGDKVIGKVGRRGMKSLWKAKYEIFDENDQLEYTVAEENPWAKVMDTLVGEIPVVSMFTGYMFNPKYAVTTPDGTIVVRLSKEPSFFGRKFKMEKIADVRGGDDERIMLSLMMMMLLERRRG